MIVALTVPETVMVSLIGFLDLYALRFLRLSIPWQLIRRRWQAQSLGLQCLLRRVSVRHVLLVAIPLPCKAVWISVLFYGLNVTAVQLLCLIIVVSAGIITMLLLYHLVLAFRPLDIYAKLLVT